MDNKIGTRSFQQQESIQPPSYNSVINTHIPQPNISFLQTSPRPVNQNINYGLQAIGVPLSSFGDITEVVYGEQEDQRHNQCCCCGEDTYLYIPDNYSLSVNDHSVIGVLCPKCQIGIIKLGYIKESCAEGNRISVCLHCKTVYPLK